jgi:hypothetical protein
LTILKIPPPVETAPLRSVLYFEKDCAVRGVCCTSGKDALASSGSHEDRGVSAKLATP